MQHMDVAVLLFPISVMPLGRSMLVNDMPDRAYVPSFFMLLGNVIDLSISEFLNAYGPMDAMLSGM